MPPTTLATRRPRQCCTRSIASCATCCASSRVGHRISAPGVAALKLRELVGSLRLGRLGGASPLAAASATARSKSARSLASACGLLLQQGVQHGQQEGRGLAAAGLAGDHQVDEARWLRRSGSCAWPAEWSGPAPCVGWVKPRSSTALDQFRRQAHLDEAVGRRGQVAAPGVKDDAGIVDGIGEWIAQAQARPALQKCRSFIYSHASAARRAAVLRQWLKNINHQTTVRPGGTAGSSAVRCFDFGAEALAGSMSRCVKGDAQMRCQLQRKPRIIARFRVFT